MRYQILLVAMVAALILTSPATACLPTKSMKKHFLDTKDFVLNWKEPKTDVFECVPCVFYDGPCTTEENCNEAGFLSVKRYSFWVCLFLAVALILGVVMVEQFMCWGKRDDPYQWPQCWIDNSKNGARRWPYELDPKLQAEHGENLAEFLALDLNKDGTLSLDEFAQAQDLATVEKEVPVAGSDFNTDEFRGFVGFVHE